MDTRRQWGFDGCLHTATLALALVGAGCGPTLPRVEDQSPQQVSQKSEVVRDNFKKRTTVIGQTIIDREGFWKTHRLIAYWSDAKPSKVFYGLDFESSTTTNPGDWVQAFDQDGKQLDVIHIDSTLSVGGMHFEQTARLVLSREYIENHKGAALRIQIESKRESCVITILPAQSAGFLISVDSEINGTARRAVGE